MLMPKKTYQKINELCDEIQEFCAQGVTNRNSRDCLMDISPVVYQIRQELRDNLIIQEDD